MKYRITYNPHHARSVRLNPSRYIFTFSGWFCSPSLLSGLISPKGLLCLPREEPNDTPFALLALLLLLLPLLLTLQKLVELDALGERSHQFDAPKSQRTTQFAEQNRYFSEQFLIPCPVFFHNSFHKPDLFLNHLHP